MTTSEKIELLTVAALEANNLPNRFFKPEEIALSMVRLAARLLSGIYENGTNAIPSVCASLHAAIEMGIILGKKIDGKPCYYDGSGLAAEKLYDILLEKGSDGVWENLGQYFNQVFYTPITGRLVNDVEFGALINATFGSKE